MKKLKAFALKLREELMLLYTGTVASQRRLIEEDARRYGGHVVWDDIN